MAADNAIIIGLIAANFAPKNRKLLEFRENLQKKIDTWHRDRKGKKIDIKEYSNFLVEIGYLKKEGKKFQIETKNVDSEISTIAGPQLVVPVDNSRYALNAANARWGSLYDALYGTDVISGSFDKNWDSKRAKTVINYVRDFLDESFPLLSKSWKEISKIQVEEEKLILLSNSEKYFLKSNDQFIGYNGSKDNPNSILIKNNNLHVDLLINPNSIT